MSQNFSIFFPDEKVLFTLLNRCYIDAYFINYLEAILKTEGLIFCVTTYKS